MEISISTQNTFFVATANRLDDIPDSILNRFSVIHMPSYSVSQKAEIFSYIWPKLLAKYDVDKKEAPQISKNLLVHVLRKYTSDWGARETENIAEALLADI